jgi:hypothetical protein
VIRVRKEKFKRLRRTEERKIIERKIKEEKIRKEGEKRKKKKERGIMDRSTFTRLGEAVLSNVSQKRI